MPLPGVDAGAALGDKELSDEKLDEIKATGAQVVGWNHEHVEKAQIELIHRRGFKAWVYTVNETARAQQLIEVGIDGIITDLPAAMLKVVNK